MSSLDHVQSLEENSEDTKKMMISLQLKLLLQYCINNNHLLKLEKDSESAAVNKITLQPSPPNASESLVLFLREINIELINSFCIELRFEISLFRTVELDIIILSFTNDSICDQLRLCVNSINTTDSIKSSLHIYNILIAPLLDRLKDSLAACLPSISAHELQDIRFKLTLKLID
jgi:hypothetical protein